MPFLRLVRAWLSPAGTFEMALRITVSSVRFLAEAHTEAGPSWTSLHSRSGRRFRRFPLLRPRTALRRSPRGIDREVFTPGRPFIDIILDGRCPAVFPPPGHDVLVVPRPDRAVSHDFAGVLHPSPGVSPGCSPLFLRRRTRGLVASRCRSWGSTRFSCWGGGAGPESLAIADVVLYRSRAFTVPRVDFTPLGGFPPLAAFRRFRRQTTFPSSSKRVTALLASVDFHVSVCPSRLCSASGSVPGAHPCGCSLAYPPWALFPFEVTSSVLAFRWASSALGAFVALTRVTDPFGGVSDPAVQQNRAPCRLPSPCIRGPSRLGTPAYSSRVCLIRRMKLQGPVATTSGTSVFPTSPWPSRSLTRFHHC